MRKSINPLPSLEKVRERLRAVGLRCTAARLWVMQQLIEATHPLTHAQVADVLRPRGFDRATIYRNLIELTEKGLVSRVELGDHVWRFELRRPGRSHERDHPHFVCVDCGDVTCLSSVSINIKPAPGSKQSRIGKITEVLLKGHCGHCS
jgi:Fur family transcriptional regulator, ferric uptake regulator